MSENEASNSRPKRFARGPWASLVIGVALLSVAGALVLLYGSGAAVPAIGVSGILARSTPTTSAVTGPPQSTPIPATATPAPTVTPGGPPTPAPTATVVPEPTASPTSAPSQAHTDSGNPFDLPPLLVQILFLVTVISGIVSMGQFLLSGARTLVRAIGR